MLRKGFVASATLLFLAATALWFWRLETDIHRERLASTVLELGAALDARIASFRLVPRLLADDPRLISALQAPAGAAQANTLLARVTRESGLAFMFLMGRDGQTVAASNFADPVSFVGQNYGFRPYFRGAVEGDETRHFAVGATTGRPGYFIAVPVFAPSDENRPIGVVVGKLELDELIVSWKERHSTTLVIDPRGVSILATNDELLYLTSRPLDDATRDRIRDERPYQPDVSASLQLQPAVSDRWSASDVTHVVYTSDDRATEQFLAAGAPLNEEDWSVVTLRPRSKVWIAWLRDLLLLLGTAAFVVLMLRGLAQRRRMAQVRASQAEELERLVDIRTRELETAQRALIAQSNFEMLGRMSAAINHEINQPLASLRLDLASARTLLARQQPDVEALSEVVIDADRTTKRIGRVVETLRRVAGPPVSLDDPILPSRLLADLGDTVKRERPVLSQSLIIHPVPVDIGVVRGNAVLLQQALLNLVYNAFDAVREVELPRVEVICASLTVERSGAQEGVAIVVTDNGCGIAPELVDTLYEPFSVSPGSEQGLGLGLALAQDIAARHDGRIVYRARQAGSEFELQLPLNPDRSTDPSAVGSLLSRTHAST